MPSFFNKEDLDLERFDAICSQTAVLDDYPHAETIEKNIVIYAGERLRDALDGAAREQALTAELCRCLNEGPGVFAIQGAYPDTALVDEVTAVFEEIIAQEKASGQGQGDHFGSNERIWNSVQKVCQHAPNLFVKYYGNPLMALACRAWLGPHYQITAQVNNVKPGGQAQAAHRDYHLGFQAPATIAQYPAHAQTMSQYLTLQGAIAHCDMPLETGPTLFLPFSQQFKPGYLAYREPEFAAYFDEHKVQIPFQKGDTVFFSPALFHGAGTNRTERDRMANLVQISSAFGRPMETVNRTAMIEAVYPVLADRAAQGSLSKRLRRDAIAAVADGYSFPTNLDSDPPVGGNAPETAAQLMARALDANWPLEQVMQALDDYAERRRA